MLSLKWYAVTARRPAASKIPTTGKDPDVKRKAAYLLIFILTAVAFAPALFSCRKPAAPGIPDVAQRNHAHVFTRLAAVPATCTEDGYTLYACDCGAFEKVPVEKLGHDWHERVSVVAICDTPGETAYSCSRCGRSYTMPFPGPGHFYASATCSDPQTCMICGHTDGDPLGHRFYGGTCIDCGRRITGRPGYNVILLIGDGMGFNTIEKARLEAKGGDRYAYAMDLFPIRGESKTASSSSHTTDSAAGGTALSSGVRIANTTVGVYPSDILGRYSYPMSIAFLAKQMGKASGVITTDRNSGATPASFTAHTSFRKNYADITNQQLYSPLDLIWGEKGDDFSKDCEDVLRAQGKVLIRDKADMDALQPGSRSFAQFWGIWTDNRHDGMPFLYEMTEKAIDLLDDDPDGFFLMVEGGHIDKFSHENNGPLMEESLNAFDKAIRVSLDYAKTHPNTLVVVTADHECGGITWDEELGEYKYTLDDHTGVNVPVLVYGSNSFIENGEILENREIGRRLAAYLGEPDFPIRLRSELGTD